MMSRLPRLFACAILLLAQSASVETAWDLVAKGSAMRRLRF